MAELDRAAISLRIAEARDKRAGLTQPELADIIGVHWRTVQDWESPKNPTVPWDRLGEIAEATGLTKEWLLHGDPPKPPANGTIDDDLAGRFEGLAYIVREQAAGITEEIRRLPRPEAPDPDLLLAELAAVRSAMERVEAGLARLADRLEPPSEAVGP